LTATVRSPPTPSRSGRTTPLAVLPRLVLAASPSTPPLLLHLTSASRVVELGDDDAAEAPSPRVVDGIKQVRWQAAARGQQ
jgi:hypothetical protein